MNISGKISNYIENSKLQGRICRWRKPFINVFITKITAQISNKDFLYSEVQRALNLWNIELKKAGINLIFNLTNSPSDADIIIHWIKVGRVFEGMCKYLSIINGEFKKISIEIGLKNEFSLKNTTNESIFFVMLHELGHTLGLGHGVEIDDLMYVPHQKNVHTPSENDIYVLKYIYNQ